MNSKALMTAVLPEAFAPYIAATGSTCSPNPGGLKRPSPEPASLLAISDSSCSVRNDRKFENRNLRSIKWPAWQIFAYSVHNLRIKPPQNARSVQNYARYAAFQSPCHPPLRPSDRREMPDEPPPIGRHRWSVAWGLKRGVA